VNQSRTSTVRRLDGLSRGFISLSGGQLTELIAVRIGHHHPVDLALADIHSRRAKGEETLDLRLLITVGRGSEVKM
jgi:hypothetical protein